LLAAELAIGLRPAPGIGLVVFITEKWSHLRYT